ncbi:MAG: DUF1840 domain-containing protein [Gammaproteobacteria bacterium]
MPITFKSRHTPNVIMLETVALELLHLMGHTGTVPGALTAADLPAALTRLKAGISAAADGTLAADRPPDDPGEDGSRRAEVSAAQRALPLIAMLETAIANDDHVIWDR